MALIEQRDNSITGLEASDARADFFDGTGAIRGWNNRIDGRESVDTLKARLALHALD